MLKRIKEIKATFNAMGVSEIALELAVSLPMFSQEDCELITAMSKVGHSGAILPGDVVIVA